MRETKPNSGRFKKGFDPRRHVFTKDECSRGFWAAVDSVIERYPDAVTSGQRHIAFNLLPALIRRKARTQ